MHSQTATLLTNANVFGTRQGDTDKCSDSQFGQETEGRCALRRKVNDVAANIAIGSKAIPNSLLVALLHIAFQFTILAKRAHLNGAIV